MPTEVEMRERAAATRYERFARENEVEISRRAQVLGGSQVSMAASMFSIAERRREREELCAPEEVLVGLGSTRVAGLSSINLSVQQHWGQPIKVVRLEVPSDVAENFFLTDLKIARNSQFFINAAVPMSVFAADCRRFLKLEADLWLVGQFLILSVTNASSVVRNFSGALVCWKHYGWQGMGAGQKVVQGSSTG